MDEVRLGRAGGGGADEAPPSPQRFVWQEGQRSPHKKSVGTNRGGGAVAPPADEGHVRRRGRVGTRNSLLVTDKNSWRGMGVAEPNQS